MAEGDRDEQRDPVALIAYACLSWLVGLPSGDADRAFRHGIGGLGRADKEKARGMDELAEAVELLKRVEPERIRAALTGHQDEEPELVAIALLLASFFPPAAA